jgi:hypothetical protein
MSCGATLSYTEQRGYELRGNVEQYEQRGYEQRGNVEQYGAMWL